MKTSELKTIWSAQVNEGVTDLTFKKWMEQHHRFVTALNQPTTTVAEVLAETTAQLTTNAEVVATVEHKVTKAELGRTIFAEELAKGSARKDIIKRLIDEAGLTKNGAATYLQNMKNKAGLVNHKPKAA